MVKLYEILFYLSIYLRYIFVWKHDWKMCIETWISYYRTNQHKYICAEVESRWYRQIQQIFDKMIENGKFPRVVSIVLPTKQIIINMSVSYHNQYNTELLFRFIYNLSWIEVMDTSLCMHLFHTKIQFKYYLGNNGDILAIKMAKE